MLNNEVETTRLTGRDRRVYLAALDKLKGLEIPLDHASRDFAEATAALKPHGLTLRSRVGLLDSTLKRLGGVQLSTVLEFYEFHGSKVIHGKTVRKILEEMLKALAADGGWGGLPHSRLGSALRPSHPLLSR